MDTVSDIVRGVRVGRARSPCGCREAWGRLFWNDGNHHACIHQQRVRNVILRYSASNTVQIPAHQYAYACHLQTLSMLRANFLPKWYSHIQDSMSNPPPHDFCLCLSDWRLHIYFGTNIIRRYRKRIVTHLAERQILYLLKRLKRFLQPHSFLKRRNSRGCGSPFAS